MSTSNPSFSQMGKIYGTLVEQGVSTEILQYRLLAPAVIADIAEAATAGTIPDRVAFRTFLKLDQLQPKLLRKIDQPEVQFSAMSRMRTADCFKTGIMLPNDELCKWFAEYVPTINSGSLVPWELMQTMCAYELAEALLEITTDSADKLQKLIKLEGHAFHPDQVADLIRRTETGEKTGLLTNGQANLLFMIDADGIVVMLCIYYEKGLSDIGRVLRVHPFYYDREWDNMGNRFFSRKSS
jgi:hypothetical protein